MKKKLLFVLPFLLSALSPAYGAVTLLDKDSWKISMNGFAELDAIFDSTRSFAEIGANAPVQRPDNINGQSGRAQLSVRDSRLGFTIEAPESGGWKTKGVLEGDFLGFDSAPPAQSEAAFFNNPTFRVRLAFLAAETPSWQLMAGQNWGLFGWQPFYFMPSIQQVSVVGMVFSRQAQMRLMNTSELATDTKLVTALAAMRPPQRDVSLPGLEGGFRLVLGSRAAGYVNGCGNAQQAQPMSIAVTGAVREFALPLNPAAPTADYTHVPGTAVAVDALLPVIAASDRKDVGNTLMLGGEFTTGRGYGDEFVNWTGNLGNPLSSGASATTAQRNINLDGGIGDFDPAGNFQLVDLRTFNAYAQYHFATESRTWLSAGYGRLYSDNVDTLTTQQSAANGRTGAGSIPYSRDQIYFANVQHDFTKQLRLGLEYAHTRTDYADSVVAHNNRYQVTAWFMF